MAQRYGVWYIMCVILCIASYLGVAQQLPNADFEDWRSSGQEPPFDWEEPEGWTSSNSVTEFTSASVQRSSDAYSGSMAAEISTPNLFEVPGVLVNGVAGFDFATLAVDILSAGTPLTEKPEKLHGWYRYQSQTVGDSAYALVLLKRYDAGTETRDTIAYGAVALGPNTEYSEFEVSITDLEPDVLPDSIIVAFFSTKPDNLLSGGVLIVDNLELDFSTSLRPPEILHSPELTLFPNPSMRFVCLEIPESPSITALRVAIYASNGRLVLTDVFYPWQTRPMLDIGDLADGAYIVRVMAQNFQRSAMLTVIKL